MRVFLVAGFLSVASPLFAQTVLQKRVIELASQAYAAAEMCPKVEMNLPEIGLMLLSSGLKDNEISAGSPYFPMMAESVLFARRFYEGKGVDERCEFAVGMFGEQGGIRENLVRLKPGETVAVAPRLNLEAPPEPPATPAPSKLPPPASLDAPPTSHVPASVEKPRLVAGPDMQLTPRKFVGRRVEMRNVSCLHADLGEYRCITSDAGVVAIFAEDVSPDDQKRQMEARCGTFAEMMKPTCRFTIRFDVRDYDEDTISGYRKRTVVRTDSIEVVAPVRKRR